MSQDEIDEIKNEIRESGESWLQLKLQATHWTLVLTSLALDVGLIFGVDVTHISTILGPIDEMVLGTIAWKLTSELFRRVRSSFKLGETEKRDDVIDVVPSITSCG